MTAHFDEIEQVANVIRKNRMIPYADGDGGHLFRAATPSELAAALANAGLLTTALDECEPDECERCEGTGDRYGRAYPEGGYGMPCPACGGTGAIPSTRKCPRCGTLWDAPVEACPTCCCGPGEGCSSPDCTGTPAAGARTPEPVDDTSTEFPRCSGRRDGHPICTCGRAWEGHPNPHAITCPEHHWPEGSER